MTRHHIMDELRDLPGTAQTRGETDVIDVESHTMNLPAVRDEPGELAVRDQPDAVVAAFELAAAWTAPTTFNRWWWAMSLPVAIWGRDPGTFKLLILSALQAGFDGEPPVSAGEFEVALLEFDAARAAR